MDIYEALRESHDNQRALCRRLLRTRPGTAARTEIFRDLFVELEAHAAAEERGFFQVSGKILTEKQKSTLARKYLADFERMKRRLRAA